MDINLGDEKIVALQATFTAEQIQEKALSKRLDAFGQIAKMRNGFDLKTGRRRTGGR